MVQARAQVRYPNREAEVVEMEYPALYYQTIADTGIDPIICGPFGEGLGVRVPSQGGSATAKPARAPRKKAAPKKSAAAKEGKVAAGSRTAKVAASG